MEQTKTNNANTIEKAEFDLIKGTFTPEEAQEILMHMLQKKIEFHELKIFSDDIRFGQSDEASIKRIEELRVSRKNTKAFLEEAKAAGKSLKIKTYTVIESV